MSRQLRLTPEDKRGAAFSGRQLVDNHYTKTSFTSARSLTPAERGMKVVSFQIPKTLRPYRFVVLGRRYRAHRDEVVPWLCLTPTPVAVSRAEPRASIERPMDEQMEYMVAWLVEEG